MENVYEKEIPEPRSNEKAAPIDSGGRICVSANMLRILNHYCNKIIGSMDSLLPKEIRISRAIQNLWGKKG